MSLFSSSRVKSIFKSVSEPVLKKTGLKKKPATEPDSMGALFRFLLMNAVSIIGAKLINEAAEHISTKMFYNQDQQTGNKEKPVEQQTGPALETRVCPRCGAFMVKGQACDCTQKA